MLEQLSVKKWGGENAAELNKSTKNVLDDYMSGIKQVIVVSAIRSPDFNTTDKLIEIGELLSESETNFNVVDSKIKIIRNFHLSIVDEKLTGNNENIRNFIVDIFNDFTAVIFNWFNNKKKQFPNKENDYTIVDTQKGNLSIIGFGEILSAFIQEKVINHLGIDGLEAETLDFKGITNNIFSFSKEPDIFLIISREISKRVKVLLEKNKTPIISGYIPGFENGIENAIGRGYTDATAAMTAVGLYDSYNITLEVQKSVLGMLSADPRIVTGNTKLIESIDYLTAKEITGARGAQAKLLHNQVLRKELQEAGIKVRLFDPFSESKGTLISNYKNPEINGVEYVGGRKNVIFFSISSGKMSGKGILSNIFNIVKNYTSVDILSTSETEISFTFDSGLCKEKLEKMSNEIRAVLDIKEDGYENFVKYEENKALIFCVGQNLHHKKGILGKAASILGNGDINIEMVSQGTMERAIVFGIESENMEKAINLLHNGLI